MNSFHLYLIIFFFTQFLVVAHGCHANEREALLNFKSSLVIIFPPNLLSSWQEDHVHRNCCNWHGVECSHDSLRVISVNLRDKNRENYMNVYEEFNAPPPPSASLKGKISPYLFNLTHLEYLDLSLNDFRGSHIPHQFKNLKNLTYLDISFSSFSGPVTTQFNNLSSLGYLDLSCVNYAHNELFPSNYAFLKAPSLNWVRGLHNLRVLYLRGVDLSEASSSSKNSFGELFSYNSNLRDLDLSSCNLNTTSFPEFHNHSQLSSLKMSDNLNLQSTIPIHLANLTSLSKLVLKNCNLQGSIPYLPLLEELYASNSGLHPNLSRMFVDQWPKLKFLDISINKVMGPIPSSISSNAPSLVGLSTPSCSIQGSIPSSICNISSLEYLFLDSNNLTGTIPRCITKLQNLRYFDVFDNSIGGSVSLIPLINELNLYTLILDPNKLTVVIDDDGIRLSKFQLKMLSLKSCNLKGLIPTFICDLTRLENIDLSSNNLTGSIPSCIFEMNNLMDLDLSQNNLQGTLPHVLHLKYDRDSGLNLAHNSLHGALPLPPKNISMFDLSHNNFSGEISMEVGEILSSVSYISLSGNQLSGSIPFSICPTNPEFLPGPIYIDLSNNKLSGVIPTSIGNCKSLASLNLGTNNLTESIPMELEQAVQLSFLLLNDNKLEGTILCSVSKFQLLEVLNLANNNLEGSMPAAFGSLYSLRILSLRSNKFNGSIPEEVFHFSGLQILDLSRNNFSGKLPRKVGNLEMLTSRPSSTYLLEYGGDVQLQMVIKGIEIQLEKLYEYSSGIDLSCNSFEGSIPEEIGLLKGLSILNLSHNGFSGIIPASVGNLTGLDSLDLSFNKLFGQIPESLTSMDSLGFLNLSYNNLSGRIPSGLHWDTLSGDGSAYVNNSFICGFLTNNICEGDQSTNTTDSSPPYNVEDHQEDAKDKLLLFAIVALGFIVGFWGLFFVLLLKKEKWWFRYWRLVDIVARRAARCLFGM